MPGHSNNLCVSSWGWRTARTPVSDLSSPRGPQKGLRSTSRYLVPGGDLSELTDTPATAASRTKHRLESSLHSSARRWLGTWHRKRTVAFSSVLLRPVSRGISLLHCFCLVHQPSNPPTHQPSFVPPAATYYLPSTTTYLHPTIQRPHPENGAICKSSPSIRIPSTLLLPPPSSLVTSLPASSTTLPHPPPLPSPPVALSHPLTTDRLPHAFSGVSQEKADQGGQL